MSCDGCARSAKERQRNYEQTYLNAKRYAIEKKVDVVLYLLPDLGYSFMEEGPARQAGITPVCFVSKLQPLSDASIS